MYALFSLIGRTPHCHGIMLSLYWNIEIKVLILTNSKLLIMKRACS